MQTGNSSESRRSFLSPATVHFPRIVPYSGSVENGSANRVFAKTEEPLTPAPETVVAAFVKVAPCTGNSSTFSKLGTYVKISMPRD